FSPDSKLLASAGEDGMVQLWNWQDDLRAGKPFAAWKAYPGSVKKVSFCRDGKVLITTGKDGTVKLWPIESFDELMQQASVPVRNNLQNNPNVSESDRHLCDDVPVSVTSPISTIPFPTTSPPTVILPSSQAIAEDYYTRGSEQADSEYIKNFPNILAKSSTNVKKAKVYVNRGANYYRQKKYPLAIKDYEEALKIDPNNVDAYINRGIAYSSLQKPEHQRAIEDYE
ncbi:tetratricopeptide repeat protein, partial [uncultured Nostoc sp.]|uniref:tetratricopeptide repeat protein n=1 Tax=uncultured Nostoc sp. TaxID=340711 RepID=UPI0035C94E36